MPTNSNSDGKVTLRLRKAKADDAVKYVCKKLLFKKKLANIYKFKSHQISSDTMFLFKPILRFPLDFRLVSYSATRCQHALELCRNQMADCTVTCNCNTNCKCKVPCSITLVRIGKALNVDRVPPLNDDSQDDTQFGSSGDDLQAFIDEFDFVNLMISNQDVI